MGFEPTTVSLMAFNFVSAVGIVFANKYVFHVYSYNFACFVTALHFVVTTLGGRVCLALNMYQVKTLNHMDVLPITASFCCFVVFNNLSLQHNSVGFYQLMKVLTTPVVVVLQVRRARQQRYRQSLDAWFESATRMRAAQDEHCGAAGL